MIKESKFKIVRNIIKLAKDLNIKIFDKMTEEWLDFIVKCRNGETHRYDIVEGPIYRM
ncbi:DUF3990 domain-containing protein [Clostridium botulinum]|uniref:DUF3990 domain-containing protein n=1 Tax=Clostridium botulinum TaxID=1491 RepID=A0A6B4R6U6_CLOBO|nr:DUF3990 domain-containing protein [Clostridium botulinum]MBN1043392.1 DUF3990 domain-containing protein [Clostridium botulinum]MBY6759473.1 DUF3990 domain-containing protein [Clostridium botulinum]MBY6809949.1 DUF3990 domain-containing protein [Clostridium botulinum]MBY6823605.1 DUF3990 domain-containing protein [Clostridium botulinum]